MNDDVILVLASDDSPITIINEQPKRRRLMKKKDFIDLTLSDPIIDNTIVHVVMNDVIDDDERNSILLSFINSSTDEQFRKVLFISSINSDIQTNILNQRPFDSVQSCHAICQPFIPKSKTINAIYENYLEITLSYSKIDSIILACEMKGKV